MTKHTQGPSWYVAKTGNHQRLIIDEETGENIAVVYNGEANAALIAAAPELLETLVQSIEESGFSLSGPTDSRATEDNTPPWVCKARAAIAKATTEPA